MITHRGAGMYGPRSDYPSPSVTGVRFVERGGFISGLVLGGLVSLVGVGAAGAPDSVNITSTTETHYNSSGQRETIVHEQRTATYSDPAGRQAALDASQAAAKGLIGYRQQAFELDIYMRDLPGGIQSDARGYRANFLVTALSRNRFILETGFGFGRVHSRLEDVGVMVDERFLGFPVRLLVPFGPCYAQATWDINMRSLFDLPKLDDDDYDYETSEADGKSYRLEYVRPSPFTLSINADIWRLAASVGLETARPFRSGVGAFGAIGIRF